MKKRWNSLFGLNHELSMWVEEEELGKEKAILLKGSSYSVKMPQTIERPITLRLKGLGKTRGRTTGDLLLHLWLNKGEDVRRDFWLSETFAKVGATQPLY